MANTHVCAFIYNSVHIRVYNIDQCPWIAVPGLARACLMKNATHIKERVSPLHRRKAVVTDERGVEHLTNLVDYVGFREYISRSRNRHALAIDEWIRKKIPTLVLRYPDLPEDEVTEAPAAPEEPRRTPPQPDPVVSAPRSHARSTKAAVQEARVWVVANPRAQSETYGAYYARYAHGRDEAVSTFTLRRLVE